MYSLRGVHFCIALLLISPMLMGLAIFPQNPDGAEMLNAALNGGVLHPSGMPLQSWINRVGVHLFSQSPGWNLSLISWFGLLTSVFLLLRIFALLKISLLGQILSSAIFAYFPILWRMALQPEKYTWIVATLLLALHAILVTTIKHEKANQLWLWPYVGGSVGIAVAQHSSALILMLPLIYISFAIRPNDGKQRARTGIHVILALVSFLAVAGGFYASLLLARKTDGPWPDWGQLQTLSDIWQHFSRADYSIISLHNRPLSAGTISGLQVLVTQLKFLFFLIVFIPLGIKTLYQKQRQFLFVLLLALTGALVILSVARLPAGDTLTVMGYAERYPLLALPFLILIFACGLDGLTRKSGRVRTVALLLGVSALVAILIQGWPAARAVNNNLVDIYRREIGRELPPQSLLYTSSDFDFFYGYPCEKGVCFPLKNMFSFYWYHDQVAPQLDTRLTPLLDQLRPIRPWPIQNLFRLALRQGLGIASNSASAMIKHPDLMKSAEQIGLVWVFKNENKSLYTSKIIESSASICQLLNEAWCGVPEGSNFFAAEILQNLRMALLGASDHLANLQDSESSDLARKVADSLKPGVKTEVWRDSCRSYTGSIVKFLK